LGKKHSEETKKKMALSRTGLKRTPEQRAKMAQKAREREERKRQLKQTTA
jgi:hypothetical protein